MAYVSKIKDTNENILDIKSKITAAIPYGECDSTSTATVFTATVDGITALYDGVCCLLKNGVKTSASGFTININGLGAKPVYSNLATGNDITPTDPTRDTTIFNINYTMFLIYSTTLVEGGAWICYRGYDSNSNDTGYYIRHSYATLPVSDTARYYKLYFTSADNTKWVPSSVHSANNATAARPVNQRPINPFGKIVYTSASTNYTAGSNLGVSYAWEQYPFTLGYAFNRIGAALTLTYPAPVYIKCAPQADGSAIIDEDVPYVQALPTSADGKIYIFLGIAYEATKVELYQDHPVYYHDGVSVKLWPGTMILGEEPLYSENSTPYKFRQIEDDGLASKELLEKIIGGSLAWNQMIDTQSFTSTTDDTRDFLNFNVRVYNGSTYQYILIKQLTQPTLVESILDSPYSNRIEILHNGATRNIQIYNNSNNVKNFNAIAGHKYFCSFDCKGVDVKTVGGLVINDMMFIDLTQTFGPTIADYVYSLETATAGAGVAWLKQYINLSTYHEYDAGSMKHVEGLVSHDTVGFNQWDEVFELGYYDSGGNATPANDCIRSKNYIPVFPNTMYYAKGTPLYVCQYDADKNFIGSRSNVGNGTFITLAETHYIRFNMGTAYGITYNNDICINLSDSAKNGTYEPYIKHSYPLDSLVVLRGISKIDTDGNLYYDGDTYEADGTVTRRYGIVDLGTLTWNKNGTATPQQAYATLPVAGINDQPGHNIMSSKYVGGSAYNSMNKTICIYGLNGTRIWLADSALDGFTAAEIKTALSEVYAVYELATPTTEIAAPYQRIQDIDNWGTQEFVTTSIIPIGHLTRYPKNLIALTEQISDTISVLPTTTTPIMDGTASVGTEREYARGDHIHPTDTSRQATLVSGTNIKTINNTSLLGSGNISTPNTTYAVATTAAAGLMPQISGSTAQILNGAGSWVDIPTSYWVYNSTNDTIELVFPS